MPLTLFCCAGHCHRCVREVSGQSASGSHPAWLSQAERGAVRGSEILGAVQEERLEHKLAESFKEHGMVHPRTKGLIRELAAKIRSRASSEEEWEAKFVEAIEGALPGWHRSMAKAAIQVALERPSDVFGRVVWVDEPDRDDDEPQPEPCVVTACRATAVSVWGALTATSRCISSCCDTMARQCVQTPSGELTKLGDSWLKDRAYTGAADAYRTAAEAERKPMYVADLHHKRAVALLGLGRPHEALDELRTALKRNSTHPPALYVFGSLVYSLRTGGEPMGHEAAMIRRVRGAAAREQRQSQRKALPTLKEAEAALRLCIKMSESAQTRDDVRLCGSSLAAAYNNHAVVLASVGGSLAPQAAARLQKSLTLGDDGGSDVSLANVGMLLMSGQTGDPDLPAAIRRLRQLVARRPQLPQAHHALGAALHRQGLTYAAVADQPASHGEADAPRRAALAKRRALVAEAAAHYRTALALQSGKARATYGASLDRALRSGRAMNVSTQAIPAAPCLPGRSLILVVLSGRAMGEA